MFASVKRTSPEAPGWFFERAPYYFQKYLQELGIDSYISFNGSTEYWREAKVYQALLYCEAHEELLYTSPEAPFTDLHFVRWHRVAMDVIPANGSKAKGIEAVLKHIGISPEEAVAFGDGLNDKEMLSYVGLGIAMGNAHDEVKPCAKFTTKHVNEGGIRHGLEYAGLLAHSVT